MGDRCIACNVELPDKLKRWASYCNSCYDKGIMFWKK